MSQPEGLQVGLVLTSVGLGFRHGIDWDHIAAITDIAGSQDSIRRSLGYATCYYVGHAATIAAIGAAAILAGQRLPRSVDVVMEHVVGVTLIALGIYIVVSLTRNGREFRMRSRWTLVFSALRRAGEWVRPRNAILLGVRAGPGSPDGGACPERDHHLAGVSRADASSGYGVLTSVGIGVLHGIGAETPTQVLLLVAAGSAGGPVAGLVLLGAFLVGLLGSNSLLAGAAALGFLGASRSFVFYASVSVLAGAASIGVGTLLFLGRSNFLPGLLAG
ncbi:MAG: hypothetical protein ACYDAD_00825 [Acidimicrobiales bacterium]